MLLHQQREFAAAAAAYERAEQRGDRDAAFNLGVLLYEQADFEVGVIRGFPESLEGSRIGRSEVSKGEDGVKPDLAVFVVAAISIVVSVSDRSTTTPCNPIG